MPSWPVSAGRQEMARLASQPARCLNIDAPPITIIAGRSVA
jgi:hypothetical protein